VNKDVHLKFKEEFIMIINHNMMAQNANRMANVNQNNASKAMAKLSSGLRINSAADDAAGLSISEKMKGQINGLNQASTNAQTGISMVQTADGALNETTANLQRMRELAVQSSSDTNTTADRNAIQKEMNQLTSEVSRVASTTQFNTQNLLDGTGGNITAAVVSHIADVPAAGPIAATTTVTNGANTGTGTTTKGGAYTGAVDKTITLAKSATGWTIDGSDITLTGTLATYQGVTLDTAGVTSVATGDSYTVAMTAAKGATADVPAHDVTTAAATSAFTFQIGANQGQTLTANISDMRSAALGIAGTGTAAGVTNDVIGASYVTGSTNDLSDTTVIGEHALDLSSASKASAAIKVLDEATASVSSERAQIGAYQNRLESTVNTLGTTSQNLTAAQSQITDVDMAATMSEYSKDNIESQAAQAMIAQANQQPQQVLQLLR